MYSYNYLKKLCEFPHRGSCSANESKAAEYIYKEMQKFGFKNVIMQKFKSPKDCMYTFPIQFGVFIVLAGVMLLLQVNPLYLSIFLILPILMIYLEVTGSLTEINFSPKYDSQNIIVFDELKKGNPTIIISGHYDTQKGSLLFAPSFQKYIQTYFNLSYLSFALIIISVVVSNFIVSSTIYILNTIGIVLSSLSIIFLIYSNATGRYINGANDNGTGTCLTMALAKHFKNGEFGVYNDVNFIFLLTGCEEVGSKGMKAFLREYKDKLDKSNTYFIVIDNIGSGNITYLEGEGMIVFKEYNKQLKHIANKLKDSYNIQKFKNLLLPTDSLPVLNQRFNTISFLGKDKYGNMENYHWHTDTIDKIEKEHMDYCERFFIDYINLLIKEVII
ncbi:M28 family metallopeptidase [Caloranaerobacter azorensis]|uniref:M28 family peptidase n=1 Tax=Caloranaerobacter azorensis TaxID=116090 RepID=A0A6P1YFY8_9FIRM|nr:M28 family peptidase [Caloranaerobacter azorensis]QIB26826.1 M28 family peptidase [Caloranaerobacter azorensis]